MDGYLCFSPGDYSCTVQLVYRKVSDGDVVFAAVILLGGIALKKVTL